MDFENVLLFSEYHENAQRHPVNLHQIYISFSSWNLTGLGTLGCARLGGAEARGVRERPRAAGGSAGHGASVPGAPCCVHAVGIVLGRSGYRLARSGDVSVRAGVYVRQIYLKAFKSAQHSRED